MDNTETYDRYRIELSLFPLDKKESFEPKIEDHGINKAYKPVIFSTNIHYTGKSNFTPQATPLKGDHKFRVESVLKTPFSNEVIVKDLASNMTSPAYEKALKDRINAHSEMKPIFESTVKANHKTSVGTFSPDVFREFAKKRQNKKSDALIDVNKHNTTSNNVDIFAMPSNINGPVLPITKMGCNCRNSQCLKLYCECFRNQTLCKNCSCKNCSNQTSNSTRKNAILAIKSKNPTAFDPKFKTTKIVNYNNHQEIRANKMAVIISRGCKCKNSNCKKKYCECYQYGLGCNDKCKCISCENGKMEMNNMDSRNVDITKDEAELGKRADFDVKAELRKKLLDIKKFKLEYSSFN